MFKLDLPETIIKLPSAGLLPGIPAEVRLRAITGKEELKMNSSNLTKYIDLVISACVTSTDPEIPFDVQKITASDKIYIFIMLRSLSYGDALRISYSCPSCHALNDASIILSELPVTPLEQSTLDNLVVTLPISKFIVELKLLNDAELLKIELEAKRQSLQQRRPISEIQDLLVKIARMKSVTFLDEADDGSGLTSLVTLENNSENKSTFQLLAEGLIGLDVATIDNAWNDAARFGVSLEAPHKCTNCHVTNTVGVDVTATEFFRPSHHKQTT